MTPSYDIEVINEQIGDEIDKLSLVKMYCRLPSALKEQIRIRHFEGGSRYRLTCNILDEYRDMRRHQEIDKHYAILDGGLE